MRRQRVPSTFLGRGVALGAAAEVYSDFCRVLQTAGVEICGGTLNGRDLSSIDLVVLFVGSGGPVVTLREVRAIRARDHRLGIFVCGTTAHKLLRNLPQYAWAGADEAFEADVPGTPQVFRKLVAARLGAPPPHRRRGGATLSVPPSGSSESERALVPAIEWILRNGYRYITLADVQRHFGLHRVTLYRRLREIGVGPGMLVAASRAEHARCLLSMGLAIEDVAVRLGYECAWSVLRRIRSTPFRLELS